MDAKIVSIYGQIAVSVLAQLTFCGTAIAAFFLRDTSILLLVVGAVIANSTSTIQFWVGSSTGSQKKDDTIAANSASQQVPAHDSTAPPHVTPPSGREEG